MKKIALKQNNTNNHILEKTPKIDFNTKKRKRKNEKSKNENREIPNDNTQIIRNNNSVTPKLTFSSSFNERLSRIGLIPNNYDNNKISEENNIEKKLKVSNENSYLILNNEINLFDSNSDKVDSQTNESFTIKNLQLKNSSKEEKNNSQSSIETQNINKEPKTNSQESNESNISLLQLPESVYSSKC